MGCDLANTLCRNPFVDMKRIVTPFYGIALRACFASWYYRQATDSRYVVENKGPVHENSAGRGSNPPPRRTEYEAR